MKIAVLDGAGDEVVARERELGRVLGPQQVIVELPPGRGLAAVRLTILSVYPGQKYEDTCISDILVDVDSDVPHNHAAENAKRAALGKWVEGRKATAAYFASKPREFPFAFTKWSEKETPLDRAAFKRRFAERDAIAKTLEPVRFKAAGKQVVRALPDGLAADDLNLADFVELLKVDQMALLETADAIASHRTSDEGMRQIWTSTARVARDGGAGAGTRVRALAIGIRDVYTERTTSTNKRELLLVYDQQGRLETLYRAVELSGDDDGGDGYETVTNTDEVWSFTYDAAAKIQTIEQAALERHHRVYDDHVGRERENRRATRVVFTGISDKSS